MNTPTFFFTSKKRRMQNKAKNPTPQNPDLSPEELPHDDEPQLFPVYVGGVFVSFERVNPDLDSENVEL